MVCRVRKLDEGEALGGHWARIKWTGLRAWHKGGLVSTKESWRVRKYVGYGWVRGGASGPLVGDVEDSLGVGFQEGAIVGGFGVVYLGLG